MVRIRRLPFLAVAILSTILCASERRTALDRYVAASDPNYKWEVVTSIPGDGYTAYVIDMTSQAWRTAAEVDKPVWKHWLTVIRPNEVKHNTGFLMITGGNNRSKPPAQVDGVLRGLAVDTGSVVAELRGVPSEPLQFPGESKPRTEDEIIAYTWDKFLRGGDENWPLRLPMTKAAVRAMDTIMAFGASEQGGKANVSKFVVAGGSKRGWTTWTTAAVDKRVTAIIPLVIDLLNIQPSFEHHWRVYGFWAPAIKDYQEMGIMDWSRTPEYRKLMKIEEPYEYRDRLTLPKFLINATGDQFFLPDSSQFYFDDLAGEKHLRYVPNADHSLRKSDAIQSLHAFYEAFLNNRARPEFTWKTSKDGTIRVKTASAPQAVKLWQATNPETRDFRLEKIGPVWTETVVEAKPGGVYEAKVSPPAKGWTAYFIELTYPSGGKHPFKFTTGVHVTPDKLPFPPFQPKPVKR
jgi:PhoPQ-activated pathogenicity-related protein